MRSKEEKIKLIDKIQKATKIKHDSSQEDLEKIVEIITNRYTDITKQEAKDSIDRTLNGYKNQLRTFMVSVAKSKLNRLINLMDMVSNIENKLIDVDMLSRASIGELLKIWTIAQSSVTNDLDFINSVIEIGEKLENNISTDFAVVSESDVETMAELALTPQQRSKIRNVVSGFLERIKEGTDD